MSVLAELMEVILYAHDMQAQVTFYRDKLGLSVKEPQGVQDYGDVYWVEFNQRSSIRALARWCCTAVANAGWEKTRRKWCSAWPTSRRHETRCWKETSR